jgi:hypothetical protein
MFLPVLFTFSAIKMHLVTSIYVLMFRIHEKNMDMASRRGSGDPSAQNIQLDLQPLCAQFPGEEAQRTPDLMSLKDPQVSVLIQFFLL